MKNLTQHTFCYYLRFCWNSLQQMKVSLDYFRTQANIRGTFLIVQATQVIATFWPRFSLQTQVSTTFFPWSLALLCKSLWAVKELSQCTPEMASLQQKTFIKSFGILPCRALRCKVSFTRFVTKECSQALLSLRYYFKWGFTDGLMQLKRIGSFVCLCVTSWFL